ncbi:molybdopterin converting factor subunit 1 [Henriciella aquimarina]|uniref:molybdopterin converting factor subunit 1 n=1 Tax=Henriciella aquimarina TaxID=545261 RepID=UPI000A0534AB|nr:molybdopterin converting factor subunit 1 [Henriciella aquimarina]
MADILYFGRLGDVTGIPSEHIALPSNISNTLQLRTWLDGEKSLGGALLEKTVRLAVNSEIVADPHPVKDGDEIAFMPPVGGG